MNILNERQKALLKSIVANPAAFGAFAGMVYNQYISRSDKTLSKEYFIKEAIDMRLTMEDMSR